MEKSKFTLSFATYQNANRSMYFYPPNPNLESYAFDVLGLASYKEYILTKNDGTQIRARWRKSNNNIVSDNFDRLLEHPKLQSIIKKKKDLILVFQSAKSEESKKTLENFMNLLFENLRSLLKDIHNMYYLKTPVDGTSPTRSQYSFNECVEKSIDFALMKMKKDLLILDSKDPTALSSALLLDDLETKQLDIKNDLGEQQEKTMKKRKKRVKK